MNLIILFGGSSYEHEISIVSAITLKDKIKKYNLIFIFVDRDRDFYLIEKENMKSKYFSSFEYKKAKKLNLQKGGFYYKKLFITKNINGIVLNLIHGRDGEDGKIAGMMQFFGIKCITPNIEASVISYNKLYTKMYAKEIGVNVVGYKYITNPFDDYVPKKFPVIIKPVRLGSSIGVTIAKNKEEYLYGLDVAFEFDDGVIIEEFKEGINEYNLAGCKAGEFIFSRVEKVIKQDFLSYEDKYCDFSRKEAKLEKVDSILEEKIKKSFKKIYSNLFEGALIRCDFFELNGEIYLNEINPIPGSMANYLFEDFDEVIGKLINYLKFEKRIDIDYSYINKIQMAKGK
jgi:D-alanine-D-alanine ligase